MENLFEIAKTNPDAEIQLQVGDELRYVDGSESWWLEWWAPNELSWATDAIKALKAELLGLGIITETIEPPDLVVDGDGPGVTYRLPRVRLRVKGFLEGPDGPELTEDGALVLPVMGSFGGPEYVESNVFGAVIAIGTLVLVGAGLAVAWKGLNVLQESPGLAADIATGGKIFAVALALGGAFLLVREVRR